MRVRYFNTMQHLVALQKYVLRRTDTGKTMMLHRFLAVEAIIIFICVVFAINHNRLYVFLGFMITSGLAWVFRARSVVLQFKKDFKREHRKDEQGLFDKERVLSISEQGLTVDIGPQCSQYDWDQVELTGRDRKHVYIILTGVLHYVIPLSAFSGEAEADNFLAAISSYRSASQQQIEKNG